MALIFISYRRSDSNHITSRIYDQLISSFGKKNIFKDVDNIPPGRDFRGVLREATAECRLMLVVIGENWLGASDESGKRRLDDPNDFVRIEVETGLQRDEILVIPLLVGGAKMPRSGQLPPALSELAYRNAFTIHDDPLFHRDMEILLRYMRTILIGRRTASWRIVLVVAPLLAVLAIAGFPLLRDIDLGPSTSTSTVTRTPTLVISPTLTVTPMYTAQILIEALRLEPADNALKFNIVRSGSEDKPVFYYRVIENVGTDTIIPWREIVYPNTGEIIPVSLSLSNVVSGPFELIVVALDQDHAEVEGLTASVEIYDISDLITPTPSS